MKLINSDSLQLADFSDNIPSYAILSHTWGDEEVSYQEYISGEFTAKSGYQKIIDFCHLAKMDGWKYVWVDTCCIDKSSSSELSESINSMHKWYQNAGLCYVYLEDVTEVNLDYDWIGTFSASRWFTRGWTLQELLAPSRVTFYNKEWRALGTREGLAHLVQSITGIEDLKFYRSASIAQIFSWASRRQTRKEEDRAYSLLGLVGVNMSLRYGEGRRAFERLQKKILSCSSDDSIFAWSSEGHSLNRIDTSTATSLLAGCLNRFEHCGNVVCLTTINHHRLLWSMTHCGLKMTTSGSVHHLENGHLSIIIPLTCTMGTKNQLTITLRSHRKYSQVIDALNSIISCYRSSCEPGTTTRTGSLPLRLLITNIDPELVTYTDKKILSKLQILRAEFVGFADMWNFEIIKHCLWSRCE